MKILYRAAIVAVMAAAGPLNPPAQAQSTSWGTLTASAVRLDYDLSGMGNDIGLAIRATKPLTDHVSLEFGGTVATPEQQFGASTLFMPEAQLQYHWSLGRFSPFLGGGLGAAMVRSPIDTDWDPTLSAAAGGGFRLTDQLGLRGEFRLRGHEWTFTGTTTEISAGLTWQLPAF